VNFLSNLDPDIRDALIVQLGNLWTHTTTALEGNSLTLAETAFVIGEGLTIKGKPVKDHQEVIGHAKAIDLLYDLLRRNTPITEQDLFLLHKAVQTNVIVDIFKPVGAWKREPNGTNAVINHQQVFINFASPEDVPYLMKDWLGLLNSRMAENLSEPAALSAYVDLHVSLVRIHPFFDGNGRVARLLANAPVLKSGYPPILIPHESRLEYIRYLSEYDFQVGPVQKGMPLLPKPDRLLEFNSFCANAWEATKRLVDRAHQEQRKRGKSK
jgi:Fic family protein